MPVDLARWCSLSEDALLEYTRDWVSEDAAVWLEQLKRYKGRPNVAALEIGSFEGRSAIWFLDHILTGKDSTITCIDPWNDEALEARFDHNIELSGQAQRVRKIKAYSQHALTGKRQRQFDFIYIDGCHKASCILTNAVFSLQLAKHDGIIIFDDYGLGLDWEPHMRSIEAIDAFLNIYRDSITVLHRSRSLVVVRRNHPSLRTGKSPQPER